ncbi:hypothetical protein MP638_005098 [Amoeboaphelidium occidentale]|nr:hypothetical protein MP638_005098 [Amoeboaphelidium occidentale]
MKLLSSVSALFCIIASVSAEYKEPCNNTTAPVKCRLRPSCEQQGCIQGMEYGAVLYEQKEFAGIKHWVDGKNDDCRGLNGTSVDSILILSGPGADPVYGSAISSFAKGVSLLFYPEFGCKGAPIGRTTGTKPFICPSGTTGCLKPLSVKIQCNGKGLAGNITAPVPPPAFASVFQETQFRGIHSWIDLTHRECRGLNGTAVASVQFLKTVGADPAVAENKLGDNVAKKYRLVFFDDFGCKGKVLNEVIGNSANSCGNSTATNSTTSCGNNARSVMLLPAKYHAGMQTPVASITANDS